MIYFPKTRVQLSYEAPIAAGATVLTEGSVLCGYISSGVYSVAPSLGTSSDKTFMGFSVSSQLTLTSFPKVETFVLGAGKTYTLARIPQTISAVVQASVYVTAAAISNHIGKKTLTTHYTVSGTTGVVDLSAGVAIDGGTTIVAVGDTIQVIYKYVPSAVEAVQIQGDIIPGGPAANLLGQVGVMKSGVIFTSEYDATIDWSASSFALLSGAGGLVTVGGSGLALNAQVISVPNSSNGVVGGFLGLEFSAV